MKLLNLLYTLFSNGAADKKVAHNMTDSFTGIETYWNNSVK